MYRTFCGNLLRKQEFYKKLLLAGFCTKQDIVISSPVADIEIPNILLQEYLWSNVNNWSDKVAVECAQTKKALTYNDVYKESRSFAGFLQKYGLKKGDVIAVILPNIPEYFIITMGAMKTGVISTLVNPMYTSEEIKNHIIRSNAKLIFTTTDTYPNVTRAVGDIQGKIDIVIVKQTQNEELPGNNIFFHEVCSKQYDFIEPELSPDDVALLQFSSGTTGLPKGVQLTHKNLISNYYQTSVPEFRMLNLPGGEQQEVIPIVVPMFHIYGIGVLTFTMFAYGVKFVMVPKFNTEAFYNVLHNYNTTLMYVVPPLVLSLMNTPRLKIDKLRTIRSVLSAAAPLGAADISRFYAMTGGKINLVQFYGMTETSPLTHHQSVLMKNGIKSGSSGLVLPNTKCKIVQVDDQNFEGIGPNKEGEILVKGPQVMKGYLNNEEANKQVFVGDGWLRTGDIGYYDEGGHFYITDRLKELIKVKGFQVAPAELEEILRNHPSIKDAAVIGVPDKRNGEVPKAFVVLKESCKLEEKDIHRYMSGKVIKYKHLVGGIEFIDEIPKTASGKILRRKLK